MRRRTSPPPPSSRCERALSPALDTSEGPSEGLIAAGCPFSRPARAQALLRPARHSKHRRDPHPFRLSAPPLPRGTTATCGGRRSAQALASVGLCFSSYQFRALLHVFNPSGGRLSFAHFEELVFPKVGAYRGQAGRRGPRGLQGEDRRGGGERGGDVAGIVALRRKMGRRGVLWLRGSNASFRSLFSEDRSLSRDRVGPLALDKPVGPSKTLSSADTDGAVVGERHQRRRINTAEPRSTGLRERGHLPREVPSTAHGPGKKSKRNVSRVKVRSCF